MHPVGHYQYFGGTYHLYLQPLFPRLDGNDNILGYLGPRKRQPELYKLAKVALKVPATQVTLERLFSNMGFILSTMSFSMKKDILQDTLIMRCYKMFYRRQ
jgi:hypothetical protein